jgi:hypothetical protein
MDLATSNPGFNPGKPSLRHIDLTMIAETSLNVKSQGRVPSGGESSAGPPMKIRCGVRSRHSRTGGDHLSVPGFWFPGVKISMWVAETTGQGRGVPTAVVTVGTAGPTRTPPPRHGGDRDDYGDDRGRAGGPAKERQGAKPTPWAGQEQGSGARAPSGSLATSGVQKFIRAIFIESRLFDRNEVMPSTPQSDLVTVMSSVLMDSLFSPD